MTSNPDVPPFIGYVETTVNALRLIHAARQGVIPRITRRLNDSERRTMIKSGAVFVFSVEESGIKRWTDGLLWSPSRIVGNFLVYREINERTSSRGNHKKPYPIEESTNKGMARRNSPDQVGGSYRSLPSNHSNSDQGTFKPNGLIKKTITVTIEGSDLHLISYYTSEDIRSGKLKRPSTRPDIMALYMPPQIFRLTNFRVPPKVEIGPDGKPRLVCEAEDLEPLECKMEDQLYNIPESPTWGGSPSQAPPINNPFGGSSLFPLSSNHTSSSAANIFGRSGDRWQMSGDSLLSPLGRQDLGLSPSGHHQSGRRRDPAILQQAEGWSPLQVNAGRFQASSHDQGGSGNLYPERSRLRPSNPYDEGTIMTRRETESMSPNFNPRFHGHNAGNNREGTTHRMQWHAREASEHAKERRSSPHSGTSFTPSPTLPFSPQGSYHTTSQSFGSSWTPNSDNSLIDTTTLHPVSSHSAVHYEASYTTAPGSLSSSDNFTNVGEYGGH